jgi:hypothetical protein
MRRHLLAAALIPALGLLAAQPAAADFATGLSAYLHGDYAAALAAWQPLAEAGDARAQLRVGQMLRDRQGVRWKDFEAAAAMFRRAAAQGVAEGHYALARLHYEGFLVPVDEREMLAALTAAARQGHARALLTLGVVYEYGFGGIAADLTQALKWYALAERRGIGPRMRSEVQAKIARLNARVRAKMTEMEIAVALELAQAWRAESP